MGTAMDPDSTSTAVARAVSRESGLLDFKISHLRSKIPAARTGR